MRSRSARRVRPLFMGALAVWLLASGVVLPARSISTHYDWCDDVCYLSTDCNTECTVYNGPENPTFDRTCDQVTDGQCGNTCEQICNGGSDEAEECNDNGGGATTCGAYGVYLQCGDGVCAADDEDWSSCPADCPLAVSTYTHTTELTEDDANDLADMYGEIDAAQGFDGTIAGAQAAIAIAIAYGYLDSSYDVGEIDLDGFEECPAPDSNLETDESSIPALSMMRRSQSCANKKDSLDKLHKVGAGVEIITAGCDAAAVLDVVPVVGQALEACQIVGHMTTAAIAVTSYLFSWFSSCKPATSEPEPIEDIIRRFVTPQMTLAFGF